MTYLLWPTVRPDVFVRTHQAWIESAADASSIRTLVAVNTQGDRDRLAEYDTLLVHVKRLGVCYPSYRLCQWFKQRLERWNVSDRDIIVLASDDFFPPLAWDAYLATKLNALDAALCVRDGFHSPEPVTGNGISCVTLPIMTVGCLRALNFIVYHPDYIHMESDIELYCNLVELGLLIDDRATDTTTFQHKHFLSGLRPRDSWDDAWRRPSVRRHDVSTLQRRMKLSLAERLVAPNTGGLRR
ncbi:MAG: hypothetical protein WB783_02585 [Arenicellales bacterium]